MRSGTQLEVWTDMVAVLGGKPLQYCRVIPRVSMATNFLRTDNLDGSLQFLRRLWLLDPIALRAVFVGPSHQVGSNRLGHTATHATRILNVEITESRSCVGIRQLFWHRILLRLGAARVTAHRVLAAQIHVHCKRRQLTAQP
jgi:hypothetical protein